MKVAITGAGGYVGSLLVRAHAERGDTVHATARRATAIPVLRGVTPYAGDITEPSFLPDAFFERADVIYHCAAEISNERFMRAVNVDATGALLARARGQVRHWIQLSSLSVYGSRRTGAIDENTPLRPASLYARTKAESDARVVEAAQGAFTYTLVRPAAAIGPNMRTGSMRALIQAVESGRFFFIGAPGAVGNYIHEDNLVDALILCATRDEARNRIYNVSQNCSIENMIGTIVSELGLTRQPHRIPEMAARLVAQVARVLPSFPLTPSRVDALTNRVEYPTHRLERELGYRHRRSVEDALRALVALRQAGPP